MTRRLPPAALLLAGLAILMLAVYCVTRDGAVMSLVSGALSALYALIQVARRQAGRPRKPKPNPPEET